MDENISIVTVSYSVRGQEGWKVVVLDVVPDVQTRGIKGFLACMEGVTEQEIILGGGWGEREAREAVKQ